MNRWLAGAALAASLVINATAWAADIPAPIAAAVADSHRPAPDTARDAARRESLRKCWSSPG